MHVDARDLDSGLLERRHDEASAAPDVKGACAASRRERALKRRHDHVVSRREPEVPLLDVRDEIDQVVRIVAIRWRRRQRHDALVCRKRGRARRTRDACTGVPQDDLAVARLAPESGGWARHASGRDVAVRTM